MLPCIWVICPFRGKRYFTVAALKLQICPCTLNIFSFKFICFFFLPCTAQIYFAMAKVKFFFVDTFCNSSKWLYQSKWYWIQAPHKPPRLVFTFLKLDGFIKKQRKRTRERWKALLLWSLLKHHRILCCGWFWFSWELYLSIVKQLGLTHWKLPEELGLQNKL